MTRPLMMPLMMGLCLAFSGTYAAEFQVQETDDGVTVLLDGKLLTRYLVNSGNKPILWPLIGPGGKELTRGYPMQKAATAERADHPHHRSLWFTHGDVNGNSFWHEAKVQPQIVHREFVTVSGGEQAVIVTRNDWLDSKGNKVCEDKRTVTCGVDGVLTWIDFDITIKATDAAVKFGDTKEGSFGVRVAGTMKVDAKLGGKIVNSAGQTDGQTWGKQAPWVDYTGPVDGQTVGIAILNHPSSFRYPTYWHVRTYGLFAANPFGLHNFLGSKEVDGSHTLQPGESITLRYRVLLHAGSTEEAGIAEAFEKYSAVEK
jgi:hypothetical protein